MADPTKYTREYSFTGYQATNPADPLPADQVDNELSNVENSIDEIVEALKDVRRSDGALVNGIVTLDSLASEVSSALGTGAADSAADAADSADAAAASAVAAALSETNAASSASDAAAALATMLAAPSTFYGTSTSSVAVSVGSKTFITQTGKFFQTGAYVLAVDNAAPTTNFVHGQVVSYSADTLVLNVTNVGGSGTISNWTIMVSGTRGAQGATGSPGAGTGDMLGSNNLSDVTNAATARSNLGLTIGTNVQAYNLSLASLAGNADASGTLEKTGATTVGTYTVTAAGKALLDDADAATQRGTLGSTATGDALFTAASASAARTTLGASSIGGTIFTAADAAAVRSALSLTSAATTSIGTSAGNLVALDGSAKLPAVDGSQLTGISSGYDPTLTFDQIWDLCYSRATISTSGAVDTSVGLYARVSGTGSSVSFATTSGNGRGVAKAHIGSTTTGIACLAAYDDGSTLYFTQSETGAFIAEFRVKINALSNGTDRFTVRAGVMASLYASGGDGYFFRYVDNVNSGKWQAVTVNTTETATDTGVTATTGWVTLRIEVNSGNSSVAFYINGSLVATNTTNIPSSSVQCHVGVGAQKSAGTGGADVYVDYIRLKCSTR